MNRPRHAGLGSAARRIGVAGILAALSAAAVARAAAGMAAASLPNPGIDGFHFPESESTVVGWVSDLESGPPDAAAEAFEKMTLHGWGLWTALTSETDQLENGRMLRVFETWFTPQELAGEAPAAGGAAASARVRARLQPLRQFSHKAAIASQPASAVGQVIGFVKYDPTAVAHILNQHLLKIAALNRLLQSGAQQIPVFPSTALSLKAAFQIAASSGLVGGRYYRLKAWSGPPATPQPWDPSKWPGCVWVDVQGGGSGSGAVDTVASVDGSSRTDATTYPVSSFICYRLTAADAAVLNQAGSGPKAAAGDYAILVAMHVAGREIARWTWQTFWWTPDPGNPPLPSSSAVASLRPAQLEGPARNYAMVQAYDMVTPGQPAVGGANSGLSLYAYNPWLEAHFAPADLPDSTPGLDPSGLPAANNIGVQTNCMSCHARANYNPGKLAGAPQYSGDRYVNLADPQFAGTLQLDFLWSLPGNAN